MVYPDAFGVDTLTHLCEMLLHTFFHVENIWGRSHPMGTTPLGMAAEYSENCHTNIGADFVGLDRPKGSSLHPQYFGP